MIQHVRESSFVSLSINHKAAKWRITEDPTEVRCAALSAVGGCCFKNHSSCSNIIAVRTIIIIGGSTCAEDLVPFYW